MWLEMLLGVVLMTALIIVLVPGLWSSRLQLHKSDDAKDKRPKSGS
ncbi:hypothetical protein [Hyalangium rubrum]|uniref:Uncharacterized protein n=1 Tax=Hyalangium rubrum TaxID=3103134 RepID=A0ABU5H432_9BACT|nr:hypothetical protein [Hyalangium sp. s54d21]MDY7228231.1 hypothetical protein [Hyalangium sp. s54d21]